MRSPTSFALAYLPHRALGEKLEQLAGPRLQLEVCDENEWLFTDRVKKEESALAKLELGPVKSLSDMADIYATTIVVPTKAEVPGAVAAVRRVFPDAQVVERRRPPAETFVYDDTHMYVSLGSHAAGLEPAIGERKFEVQIKSGLQYAWWRATHDVLYKGAERSWQLSRVAGQVRAALELLDTQLGDLRGSAELAGPLPANNADEEFATIAGWLSRWEEERRPTDISRFVRSVRDVLRAGQLPANTIEALLDDAPGSVLVANPEVTPFQAVLGSAITEKGAALVNRLRGERYVLVSEELIEAAPATAEVAEARRAKLD